MADCYMNGREFTSFLVTELPYYDKEILRDIRPSDGEIGHFVTGMWPSFTSASHTKDRFNVVFPNVTAAWRAAPSGSCIGGPCTFPTYEIGSGNTRITYSRQQISYRTQLMCFDQQTDQTAAVENLQQIISDILRPATSYVVSDFCRRNAADLAAKKWLANSTMTDFTFSWSSSGGANATDLDILTTSGDPTSLLTPQMLQRRYNPLLRMGYLGKTMGMGDMPPMMELVTDNETLWSMNQGDAAILRSNGDLASTQWRFFDFAKDVPAFWKYGWIGSVGNYACRIDPFPLRFNKISAGRYQRVLPYVNEAATNGLRDVTNPDYELAQYQFSRIHHPQGMRILTKTLETVSPLMPYVNRSLGGEWRFAMNNLGTDCRTGLAIENFRENQGFFWSDFDMAAEPLHTEWMDLIFHQRSPACIVTVTPCAPNPGYPTQNYDSANTPCDLSTLTQTIYPVAIAAGGNYHIAANTVTVNGVKIVHSVITGSATLAALATEMTTDLSMLGTFTVGSDGVSLVLTGAQAANNLYFPWIST